MAITKPPEKLQNSKVGTALAEAACQKVVPIYPVRYSAAPSKEGSTSSFKDIKSPLGQNLPTLKQSEYILRTLRPETYVYVYNENSDSKLTCFFYSKEHKGTSSPLFYYHYEGDLVTQTGGSSNKNGGEITVDLEGQTSMKIEMSMTNNEPSISIISDDIGHDHIWADCEKTKAFSSNIRIGVTDAFPSPRIWKRLKNDADFREKLLPTVVPVKKWIDSVKTAKDSLGLSSIHNFYPDANDPNIKDTFFPSTISLQTHILDFQNPDLSWSEIEQNTTNIGIIKAGMRISDQETHIGVALHDPIGLASELNNIAAHEAAKVAGYINDNHHAITSAKMISGYLKSIDSEEVLKPQIAIAREKAERNARNYSNHHYSPYGYGGASRPASPDKVEGKIRDSASSEKARMQKHLRKNGAALEQEIENYKTKLKAKDKPIAHMVDDCLIWVDSKKPAYVVVDNALWFYDGVHETLECYDDDPFFINVFRYEDTILHLFKAMSLTERGKNLLKEEILIKSPAESKYWKALARGDKELWKVINEDNKELWEITNKPLGILESLANVMSKVNDYGLNPFSTDKLTALSAAAFAEKGALKSYSIQVSRLKTIIAVRYQGVISPIIHTMTQVTFSEHMLSWNLGGTTNNLSISKDLLAKIKLNNLETISANIKKIGANAEVVSITSWVASSSEATTLPEIINHTKYTPSKNPINQMLKFVSSNKVGGSVAGAVSIIAFFDFKKNLTNMVTTGNVGKEFFPLLSSSAGLISGVAGLMDVTPKYKIKRTSDLKFKIQRLTSSTTKTASMALKVSIVAGAVASFAGAINDGIQANQSLSVGDNDSAMWRMGASGTGLILAGATIMGGVTAGVFGSGAIATALAGALAIGPVGWAVIALVALGALIYFSFKADGAKDTPIEIWLKRSYWGNHNSYNLLTETKAFEAVFYRPSVSADWNDDFWDDYDKLELTISLPQYTEGKSKLSVVHSATLDGEKLQTGLKTQAENKPNQFYNFSEKVISSGEGYMIKKLEITLDDDAKASVELVYQPNALDYPELVIVGSTSGKSWTFEDDGVFKNTIDSSEFAIIKDQ